MRKSSTPKWRQMVEIEKWLDNTKIASLERCPREFFLRHVLFLTKESEGSVATEFGKAFHLALDLFFTGTPKEEAINKACLKLQESIACLIEAGNERVYEDGRADLDTLVRALHYFLTAGAGSELAGLLKSCKTELKLSFKDPETGWSLLGRIDLLGETHSGSVLLVDFKTTGWSIKNWGNKLITDTQLQTYAFISTATAVVRNVDAGAYAVLQVQRRRLKSGALSPNVTLDSALLPIALTTDHLLRAEERFKRAVRLIEEFARANSFDCVWSSCNRLHGICQFHPLCERFWRAPLSKTEVVEELEEVAYSLGFVKHRWYPFEET